MKIPWGERWGSTPKPPPPQPSPFLPGLRHCVHDITTSTRTADSCRGRQKSMCAVTKQAWPETHVCRPVLATSLPSPTHHTRLAPPPVRPSPAITPVRAHPSGVVERGGWEDDGKIVRTRFFFFLINMYRLWRCRQGVKFAAKRDGCSDTCVLYGAIPLKTCTTFSFSLIRTRQSARPPSTDNGKRTRMKAVEGGSAGKLTQQYSQSNTNDRYVF